MKNTKGKIEISIGNKYKICHKIKGDFIGKVISINKEFVKIQVSGKARISLRISLCSFEEVR